MQVVKEKVSKKITITEHKLKIIPSLMVAVGLVSPLAVYIDYPLPIISLILVQCLDLSANMIFLATGSLITLGIISVINTYYLPYFIAYAVYFLGMGILKKRKIISIASIGAFVISRLITSYNIFLLQDKVFIVLEVLALLILPSIMEKSINLLNLKKPLLTFEDYCCTYITILTIGIAFQGANTKILYAGIAVCFAIALYYMAYNQITLSLISVIAALTLIVDTKNFAVNFAVYLIIYAITALLIKSTWWHIYAGGLVTAVAFTVAFIKYFNSFNIIVTVSAALIIYLILSKTIILQVANLSTSPISNEKDYHRLLLSVQKLDKALKFLGNTAVDISKLTEKTNKEEALDDLVANEVCKSCPSSTYCWQEKYSQTQEQFSKYANGMYYAKPVEFDLWFCNQCKKITSVQKSFEENSRLLLSRRYIKQSQKNSQKMLQTAFLAIAHTVGDIAKQNKTAMYTNTAYTMQMDNFLINNKIQSTYCLATQNPDKFVVASYDELTENTLYKIQIKLESLYNQKFKPAQIENYQAEIIYTFCATAKYSYDFKWQSVAYKEVCGDECECFEVEDKVYLILSDGMGTGRQAAAESKTALSMAKSLLSAQVDINSVVEIVNLALNLKNGGESGASIDIFCADLYTGKATITKAGAGESILLNKNNFNRFYKDTLPLGILKDVKTANYDFNITDNDTVLLMSDGVQILTQGIKALHSHSCEGIVNSVIQTGKSSDDCTVAALKFTCTA